jgi:hypothetical protein
VVFISIVVIEIATGRRRRTRATRGNLRRGGDTLAKTGSEATREWSGGRRSMLDLRSPGIEIRPEVGGHVGWDD